MRLVGSRAARRALVMAIAAATIAAGLVSTGAPSAAVDHPVTCGVEDYDLRVTATAPAQGEAGGSVDLTDLAVSLRYPDGTLRQFTGSTGFLVLAGVDGPIALGTTPVDPTGWEGWTLPTASIDLPETPGPFAVAVERLDISYSIFGTPFTVQCVPDGGATGAFATVEVVEPATTTTTTSTSLPSGPQDVTSPVTGAITLGGVEGTVAAGSVFNGTLDESTGALTGTMTFPRLTTTNTVSGTEVTTDQQVSQVGAGTGVLAPDGTATWEATMSVRLFSLQFGTAAPTVFPDTCAFTDIEWSLEGTWDPATREVTLAEDAFEVPALPAGACGDLTAAMNGSIAGFNTAVELGLVLEAGETPLPPEEPPVDPPAGPVPPVPPPAGPVAPPAQPVRTAATFAG